MENINFLTENQVAEDKFLYADDNYLSLSCTSLLIILSLLCFIWKMWAINSHFKY